MRLVLLLFVLRASAKLNTEEDDTRESEDRNLDQDSIEHIGASLDQITSHPYAASLLNNGSYVCSAVILNEYWLITDSKCFDPNIVSETYVIHTGLSSFMVRVGSSYNYKGGALFKITTLINNFDLNVTAMKLSSNLEFNSRVQPVTLPGWQDEATLLGYLATMIAWTPTGHMRIVNAPMIESSICDEFTKLSPGNYICVGGVQDINRKFCRRDNGGAVIQNNTLVGITSFLHTCALYSRTHAFPKATSFSRWLDNVIWDEGNRPTTHPPKTIGTTGKPVENVTETDEPRTPFYGDPRQFMMTLPFEPINVPLEPTGDNSVLPRLSLYESYLQNMARARTSTTQDPKKIAEEEKIEERRKEEERRKKHDKSMRLVPHQQDLQLYDNFNYN